MELLDVDGEGGLASLDDCGEHAEEVSVVDCPDLLHEEVSDPTRVLGFLKFHVAHDPFLVGR